MKSKQGSAFITTRKGFCYLTLKVGRSNVNIKRIRNYTLSPQDKRVVVYQLPAVLIKRQAQDNLANAVYVRAANCRREYYRVICSCSLMMLSTVASDCESTNSDSFLWL